MNLNAGFPVLSFTTAIPKSPDSHSAFPGKAHPFVCIPLFSALIQQALSPIISNSTQKVKTGISRLQSTLFQLSFLKAGIYIHFKAAVRATAPYQPIKFCLLLFLSEFEIVNGENAAGEYGYGGGEP